MVTVPLSYITELLCYHTCMKVASVVQNLREEGQAGACGTKLDMY